MRFLFTAVLNQNYDRDQVITGMHLLRERVPATVYRDPPQSTRPDDPARPRLEQILEAGALRVGYFPDSLPYAYFNREEELVGFDVEMAHILAEELGLELEFVPMDRTRVSEQLQDAYCDILMSGYPVTTRRAAAMTYLEPYAHETFAFLVRDHRRADFTTRESILAQTQLRVAIPGFAYAREISESLLPGNAEVRLVNDPADFFNEDMAGVDALFMTAERGSAWSLLYPQFSVVVPQPDPIRIPIAYPVAHGDRALADFLTKWIALKKSDGTLDAFYDYWILGRNAEPKKPRWSIVRNVLGWVD